MLENETYKKQYFKMILKEIMIHSLIVIILKKICWFCEKQTKRANEKNPDVQELRHLTDKVRRLANKTFIIYT